MTMAVRIRPEIVGRGYFAVSRYFLFFLPLSLSRRYAVSVSSISLHIPAKGTVWQRSWAQGPDYTLNLVGSR